MIRPGHRERLPTLAERWQPRRNSFGLLRLVLAFGVLIAHTWPVGFGMELPSAIQYIGPLSLFGLIIVAGFLNTDSGLRSTGRQFAWRRFLRIFPGLWVCLLLTALVFAPLVALYENGNLHGFWVHSQGPFPYLVTNWFGAMDQLNISGLLAHTPYGRSVGGPSAFDGSLWSLRYEFGCYAVLGLLIAKGTLRRRPRVVLPLLFVAYLLILWVEVSGSGSASRPGLSGAIGPIPLLGAFAAIWIHYLGFAFLLGVAARLYMRRIPMHGVLAAIALAIVLVTLQFGSYVLLAIPAWAYLLLYVVVALPVPLTKVGRTRDYSYGIYIYAFPVQQMVALVGGARYGLAVYTALCVAGTLPLAALSWHLVERPALGLKNRGPELAAAARRRYQTRRSPGPETSLDPGGGIPEVSVNASD